MVRLPENRRRIAAAKPILLDHEPIQGKKNKRDPWYGLKEKHYFDQFNCWRHHEGKEAHGGNDTGSRSVAEELYREFPELHGGGRSGDHSRTS